MKKLFVAALIFFAIPGKAQLQKDTSKTITDFTGVWDGFTCMQASEQGKPQETRLWRLTVEPTNATLVMAEAQTHPLSTSSITVDNGVLTLKISNGPDAVTPMIITLKLAFAIGKSTDVIGGDSALTYVATGETLGGNFAAATRSDPKQTLDDFAKEFANQCAR